MGLAPDTVRDLGAFLLAGLFSLIAFFVSAVLLGIIGFVAQQLKISEGLILGTLIGSGVVAYTVYIGALILWRRRKRSELFKASFVLRKHRVVNLEQREQTELLKLLSILSKYQVQLVIATRKPAREAIRCQSTAAITKRIHLLSYDDVQHLLPAWWVEYDGLISIHFFVQPNSHPPVDVPGYLKNAGFLHCWEDSLRADPILMAVPLLDLKEKDISIMSLYGDSSVITIYSKCSTLPVSELLETIITDIIPGQKQAEAWRNLAG